MLLTEESMAREISAGRKATFYLGIGLLLIGFYLVGTGFLRFTGLLEEPRPSIHGELPGAFRQFALGAVVIAFGGLFRVLGSRGIAGSGLMLDPRQARRDLEPHARMAGGLVRDAAEEAGFAPPARVVQRLECGSCGRTNESDARFCQGCGKALRA